MRQRPPDRDATLLLRRTPAQPSERRLVWRRRGFWLGVGAFVVYNLNLSTLVGCGDDVPLNLTTLAILRHGTVSMAAYQHLLPLFEGESFYSIEHAGRLISIYPLAPSVLSVPFFAVAAFVGGDLPVLLLGKLAASAMTAASVGLVFASLRRLGASERTATLLGVVYAIGSPVFTIASQQYCQHPVATLAAAAALYGATRASEPMWPCLGALAAGVAVAIRPQMAATLGFVGIYILVVGRRQVPMVVAAAAAPLIATVASNQAFLARPLGGYVVVAERWPDVGFHGSLVEGVGGLLISPARGLLTFMPVAVFAIGGTVRAVRRRDWLVLACAAGTVATLVVFGKTFTWHGGRTYGPRYLVEAMPLVMVMFLPLFARPSVFGARRWLAGAFLLLAGGSVFVQVVGAFSQPCSWGHRPARLGDSLHRLWDWTDTPLTRCLSEGLRIGGRDVFEVTPGLEDPGEP